jgi:hypothetical protein
MSLISRGSSHVSNNHRPTSKADRYAKIRYAFPDAVRHNPPCGRREVRRSIPGPLSLGSRDAPPLSHPSQDDLSAHGRASIRWGDPYSERCSSDSWTNDEHIRLM